MMTGHLRSQGLKFGERQIGDALRRINAPANARRRQNAGRSFNPRTYNADYFGHKIHFDQNEKNPQNSIPIIKFIIPDYHPH